MVLNPALYAALKRRFGIVKVSSPGVPASYRMERNEHGRYEVKFNSKGGGEQYSVCCPFCGDSRYRLEIGHTWLKIFPRTTSVCTFNAKCYNEGCKGIYEEAFYRPLLNFIQGSGELIAILAAAKPEEIKPRVQMRMPVGCVPLDQLPAGHRALTFLAKKYNGLTPEYLARYYGACFTAEKDDLYRLAFERIIFPVLDGTELVGWQGRAIDPSVEKRWLLPPGFQKVLYNGYRVGPMQVPIICEGITSSICSGPSAVALFGKEMDEHKAKEFAAKWETAVIALDPETFLPDPHASGRIFALELKERLDKFLRVPAYLLKWPAEAMTAAERKFEYEYRKVVAKKAKQPPPPKEEHQVPDAADYGIATMATILHQVPLTHRGAA